MQAVRGLVGRLQPRRQMLQKRLMSSGASQEESLAEMEKWKKITVAAIPVCVGYAIYCLSASHDHHHDAPEFSYLKLRAKEFPWGKCDLFDGGCWKQEALEAAGESE